ncbi:MAG: helix-turn-helix domain-containing protein [Nitrospinota bacterium]
MAENLGEILKKGRIAKGFSVEEFAAKSRINVKFITSAEANKLEELPGDVYIKGFLRTYAQFLALDEDLLLRCYNEMNVELIDRTPKMISIPLERNRAWIQKLVYTTVAIIILFIIGVSLFFSDEYQSGQLHIRESEELSDLMNQEIIRPSDVIDIADVEDLELLEKSLDIKEEDSEIIVGDVEPDKEELVERKKKRKVVARKDSTRSKNLISPNVITQKLVRTAKSELKIVATERCWVKLQVDNGKSREFTLKEGEEISFQVKDQFLISIGKASEIELYINDEIHKLPATDNNVILDMMVVLSHI